MALYSRDSVLVTPVVVAVVCVLCWKEEVELVNEFGEQYQEYQRKVPMLVPRLRR